MKRLTRKSTRLTLSITLSVFLAVLLALTGVGIYFVVKSDEYKNPEARINPLGFSVDAWDGRTYSEKEFIGNLANRGEKTKTIDSAESFAYFVKQVNKGSTYEGYTIYLNKSIDLNGNALPSIKNFKGVFDGGYYTIMNGNFYEGALFQTTENATIKNLGLYNCNFREAGVVNTAINTNLENVFVRLGGVAGLNTAGLVGKFISSNGEHSIKNSFVDANVNYAFFAELDTEDNAENTVKIDTCYYTNSKFARAEGNVKESNVVNVKTGDFSKWNYAKDYESGADWCDYAFAENSDELSFNYPILRNFVKVYLKGSYIESIVTVDGEATEITSLSDAAKLAGANQVAEVDLIVEKIFSEEETKVAANSTLVINAVSDATIVRGQNNTGALISATEEGSKLVIGTTKARSSEANQIVLDGNRDYVEANDLNSGALVASFNDEIEFGSNVVLKNNINNQTAGGAVLIVGGESEDVLNLSVSVDNCSSTSDGGGICVIDQQVNISNGVISNCTSNGNGGGVSLISSESEPEVVNQIVKVFGAKNNIRPLATNIKPTANAGTQTPAANATIENLEIYGNATTEKGGGVYARLGAVTIKNCNIYDNRAHYTRILNTGALPASDVYGGGVYSSYTLTITGTKITENTAVIEYDFNSGTASDYTNVVGRAYGGGIYTTSSLNLTDSDVSGNGSAVYYYFNNTNLIVSQIGSVSARAGGIHAGGAAVIKNSTINNNETSGEYGGLYALSLEMQGGSVSYNKARNVVNEADKVSTKCSAMFVDRATTLENVTIEGNSTLSSSATDIPLNGYYVMQLGDGSAGAQTVVVKNCLIANNSCGNGSIIRAGNIYLQGSTIQGNSARLTESVINAKNIYVNYTTDGVKSSTFGKTVLSSNVSELTSYGLPVGMYDQGTKFKATNDFYIYDAEINDNSATLYTTIELNEPVVPTSGIVYAGNLKMENVNAYNNVCCGNSAFTGTTGVVTITNCEFKNNRSDRASGLDSEYQPRYCDASGTVSSVSNMTVTKSKFINNVVSGNGGALAASTDSTLTITSSIFQSNLAKNDGGAVHAGILKITSCEFIGNTACNSGEAILASEGNNGGAIYSTTATISKSTFDGNSTADNYDRYNNDNTGEYSGNGGAIYTIELLTITDSIISDNYSNPHSAMMYHEANGAAFHAGDARLTNCDIVNNYGEGNVIEVYGTLVLNNSRVINNRNYLSHLIYCKTLYINYNYNTSTDTYTKGTSLGRTYITGHNGADLYSTSVIHISTAAYIYNAEISDNTSTFGWTSGVGQAAVLTCGTATMEKVLFQNNRSSSGGAACNISSGTIIDCEFRNNSTSRDFTNFNPYYYNGQWYSMPSEWSGALNIAGDATITNTNFSGNSTDGKGGAIYIKGALELTNCNFKNNSVSNLTYTDSDGNTYNSAASGGAVYAEKTVTATTCSFENNTAANSGGAVWAANDYTYLGGCTVSGNKATNGYGGAVYTKTAYINRVVSNNAWDSSVPKAVYSNNTAKYGGAVYTTGVTNVYNTEFIGNTSSYEGGAIGTSGGAVATASSSFLKNICKSGNGGAISAAGYVALSTCTIQSNKAYTDGGGIYSKNSVTVKESSIASNTATNGAGGGIYASAVVSGYKSSGGWIVDETVTTTSIFMNNKAKGNGGAIYAPQVYLSYAVVTNNASTSGAGGGAYSNNTVKLNKTTISYNTAATSAGGFNSPTANIDNSNILYNDATTSAGGMNVGTLTLTNSVVLGNNALGGSAGGINATTATIENSTLVNNTSTNNGGAITAKDITISDSSISLNKAANSGGAIYSSGILVISGSNIFRNNTESSHGGAIRSIGTLYLNYKLENSTYVVDTEAEKSYIYENTSGSAGGGVNGSTVYVYNADITNNTSTGVGGGFNVTTATIANSNISNNTASNSGAGLYVGDTVTITDSTISDNKTSANGGGLYVANNAYLTNTAITNNTAETTAGGIRASSVYVNYKQANETYVVDNATSEAQITGNTSGAEGGAIWANYLYIYNANISNNTAGGNGGALFASSIANIQRATLNLNSATHNGGAIYAYGGTIYINYVQNQSGDYEADQNLSAITLTYNEAQTGQGGAIFADSAYICNANVSNNTANNAGAVKCTSLLESENSQYTYNSSTYAGAIYTDALSLVSCDVNNNHSDENGGGIVAIEDATIITSTIKNNTAGSNGGGVYAHAKVAVFGSDISENTAQASGGGIITRGILTINYNYDGTNSSINTVYGETLIQNNKAVGTDSAGVGCYGALIYNANVSYNVSRNYGAGVFIRSTSLTSIIKNSTIEYNESTELVSGSSSPRGGAGVFCYNSLSIDNCVICHNISQSRNGGGVFAGYYAPDDENYDSSKTLTITNSTISDNIAGDLRFNDTTEEFDTSLTDHGNGGGVYSNIPTTITDTVISSNKAYNGGGVYTAYTLTIDGTSSISSNTANGNGGGVCLMTVNVETDNNEFPSSSITGEICYNKAVNGAGIYANNAYFNSQNGYTVTGCNIHNNEATGNGGGLCVMANIESYTYYSNHGTHYVTGNISSNKAANGGGIYYRNDSWSYSEIFIGALTLNYNEATTGNGGGAYFKTDEYIGLNITYLNGEGFWEGSYWTSNGKIEIKGNKAAVDGGGIYSEHSNFGMQNVQVLNNTAGGNGGGICASQVDYLMDSNFSGNSSGANGGAIYSSHAYGYVNVGLRCSYNTMAGEVIYQTSSTINFTNNTAAEKGGAIYSQDNVLIGETNFTGNTAKEGGAIYADTLDANYCNMFGYDPETWEEYPIIRALETTATFKSNTATAGNGGAICLINAGYSRISGITATNNTASGNGGAIYGTGNLLLYGTIMERNSATNGGAIYTTSDVSIVSSEANDSRIINNTAAYGGGLYVEGACTINVANLANLSANNLDSQAAETKGADLYANAGTYINYTGNLTETVHPISVYINGIDLNGIVASAQDSTNANFALRHITLENGNRIGVNGNNIVVIKEAYAVTFNPNGGTLTYNTTETTSEITLYTTKNSTKLYTDEALTTEVTSISVAKASTAVKKFVFEGWTCDAGNTLAKNILAIDVAEGSSYVAVFSEEYLNHTYNISAATGGSVDKNTVVASGEYAIVENGNKITIAGTEITATADEGYIFTGWTLEPNHETETTTVTANFSESVTISLSAKNSDNNVYGVILLENGVEVERHTSSFEIAKNSSYSFKLFTYLKSSASLNSYQFCQYSINGGAASSLVHSYNTNSHEFNVTLDLSANVTIEFVYTAAHYMEISYSSRNLIQGFGNLTVKENSGFVVDLLQSNYLVSNGAEISFTINSNKLASVDANKKVYFTGLTYTLLNGQLKSQGELDNSTADISNSVAYVSLSDGIYTYKTKANVQSLVISVFEGQEVNLTLEIEAEESPLKGKTTKLTLKASDGAITTITSNTKVLRLYASKWEIQDVGSASLDDLKEFFKGVSDDVTQEGGTFYVTIA